MPHRAQLRLVVLSVMPVMSGVVAGCHATPASVTVLEPAKPEPAARTGHANPSSRPTTLACDVSVDPKHEVRVAGNPTGLYADFDDEVRLRSFVWSDDTILVAVGRAHPWRSWVETTEQHTLWRIPCADPSAKVVALHVEGADFSWAESSPDGRGLYFSYEGVQFYDYATDSWGPVVAPAQISPCWMAESPVTAGEYITGWAGVDALALVSGGPCGFEAEWRGAAEVIELPTDQAGARAGQPTRRSAAHVASVAADAGGRLWVANGGLCSEAETSMSRGAAGLWRSVDDGERWEFVVIPELDGLGVDAVWAAASAPGRLLVRSECCYVEAADFCVGGKLLLSEDAGASWARVSPGLSGSLPGEPNSYGPVTALHVGPELLELEAFVERDVGGVRGRSSDGGRRWARRNAQPEIEPSLVVRELELHGWVFAAGPNGLVRRRPEGDADVVLRPLVINADR